MMLANYIGHEAAYQRLREQPDRPGWDSSAQLRSDIEILSEVIEWPAFPKAGRLLEMGCGAGNISLALAKRGYQVHGIDIAPTAIEWARQNALQEGLQAIFHVSSVLNVVEFEDQFFDIILDGHCLHCIIGADRALFFATALRLLRPGGSLCIRTMCNEVPKVLAERSGFDPVTRCCMSGDRATRYIGLESDIVSEVVNVGFDIVQMQLVTGNNADDDLDELIVLAVKP